MNFVSNASWFKVLFIITLLLIYGVFIKQPSEVTVKYRLNGRVPIGSHVFEYISTSHSSFVDGVWYDDSNQYLVIKLQDVYYHYCLVPEDVFSGFKSIELPGEYYNSYLKGNFSCKHIRTPEY